MPWLWCGVASTAASGHLHHLRCPDHPSFIAAVLSSVERERERGCVCEPSTVVTSLTSIFLVRSSAPLSHVCAERITLDCGRHRRGNPTRALSHGHPPNHSTRRIRCVTCDRLLLYLAFFWCCHVLHPHTLHTSIQLIVPQPPP